MQGCQASKMFLCKGERIDICIRLRNFRINQVLSRARRCHLTHDRSVGGVGDKNTCPGQFRARLGTANGEVVSGLIGGPGIKLTRGGHFGRR